MTKPKNTQPAGTDGNRCTTSTETKYTISFTTSQPAAQEILELVSRSATPGTRITICSDPMAVPGHLPKPNSRSLPSTLPERFDDFSPTY